MIDFSAIPWYGKVILAAGVLLAFYVVLQRGTIIGIEKLIKK